MMTHDPKQIPSPSPTHPTRFLPKSPTGSGVATGSVGKRDAKMEGRPGEVKGAGMVGVTGLHRIIFSLPEAKDNQPQEELVGLESNAQPRPSRKRRKVTCPIHTVAISFWDPWQCQSHVNNCVHACPHMCSSKIWDIISYRLSNISSQLEPCLGFFFNPNNPNICKKHSNPTILTQTSFQNQ